jgi:hypothetical protein
VSEDCLVNFSLSLYERWELEISLVVDGFPFCMFDCDLGEPEFGWVDRYFE